MLEMVEKYIHKIKNYVMLNRREWTKCVDTNLGGQGGPQDKTEASHNMINRTSQKEYNYATQNWYLTSVCPILENISQQHLDGNLSNVV